MGEFIKGWRRKTGVMTLMIACVFATGWVRSLNTLDILNLMDGEKTNHVRLISFAGLIDLQVDELDAYDLSWVGRNSWHETELFEKSWRTGGESSFNDLSTYELHWDAYCLGFGTGHVIPHYHPSGICRLWTVPYGFILMALSILSAWLLLSKPRVAKPKIVGEK